MTRLNPSVNAARLPVPGFESTAYAYVNGRVAWVGQGGATDHPRNATRPWQPQALVCDAARLAQGARICLDQLGEGPAKGLLLWLLGQPLPFPLNHAARRFDAIRSALALDDIQAFEAAALRVLGLGHGLTPSGDDFVGGIFFGLNHAPRALWLAAMPGLKTGIRSAAATATNPISAALLDDLMAGQSYRALHDLLAALQSRNAIKIKARYDHLMGLGATSGADMLAGVLLALLTMNVTH